MHIEQNKPVIQPVEVAPLPEPARYSRLWLPLVLVAAYWGFQVLVDQLEWTIFYHFMATMISSIVLLLVFLIWWWANRRLTLRDKAIGFGVFVIGAIVAAFGAHPSVGGMSLVMGPAAAVVTVWALGMLLVWHASPAVRRVVVLGVLVLAWGSLLLVRTDGITADLKPSPRWRWSQTREQGFLQYRAQKLAEQPATPPAASMAVLTLTDGDWPAYRGADRDNVVRGVQVRTDWNTNPPRPVWRHPVGPAWSSLLVVGNRVFTQEQHDKQEAVVCYNAATGDELWSHEDPDRFYEPVSEAGPRATPAFADGRLYTVGGRGLFNCLDAVTGKVLWRDDLAAESGAQVPMWGFSGSPLVTDGLVLVFAGGPGPKQLLAYRADSGDLAWSAPTGAGSYSSPQPAKLGGVSQVLMLTNRGLTAVETKTGNVLWEHLLELPPSAPRSVQPAVIGDNQVLIASEADLGIALLDVYHGGNVWNVTQRWVSRALRPSFNDPAILDGYAYGFDGRNFGCVDLQQGKRRWKGDRYGHGQVLLLADQRLLLVLSDEGEVILLHPNPEHSEEVARFQAIEGKTWNHPVVAHGRLYVRNAQEMACYELAAP